MRGIRRGTMDIYIQIFQKRKTFYTDNHGIGTHFKKYCIRYFTIHEDEYTYLHTVHVYIKSKLYIDMDVCFKKWTCALKKNRHNR